MSFTQLFSHADLQNLAQSSSNSCIVLNNQESKVLPPDNPE